MTRKIGIDFGTSTTKCLSYSPETGVRSLLLGAEARTMSERSYEEYLAEPAATHGGRAFMKFMDRGNRSFHWSCNTIATGHLITSGRKSSHVLPKILGALGALSIPEGEDLDLVLLLPWDERSDRARISEIVADQLQRGWMYNGVSMRCGQVTVKTFIEGFGVLLPNDLDNNVPVSSVAGLTIGHADWTLFRVSKDGSPVSPLVMPDSGMHLFFQMLGDFVAFSDELEFARLFYEQRTNEIVKTSADRAQLTHGIKTVMPEYLNESKLLDLQAIVLDTVVVTGGGGQLLGPALKKMLKGMTFTTVDTQNIAQWFPEMPERQRILFADLFAVWARRIPKDERGSIGKQSNLWEEIEVDDWTPVGALEANGKLNDVVVGEFA